MKILFFGDIVGKGGRKAVASVVGALKKETKADAVLANAENIAHGVGITTKTLTELHDAGIDAFTSGNHVFAKEDVHTVFAEKKIPLIRPHNFPEGPGSGMHTLRVGAYQLLLLNLQGQVFMREGTNNPFQLFDEMLKQPDVQEAHGILVDFHAEATSEKVAFGWHADGRVSCVLGTHTHIPTADARILPQGTAYVTDVGMCGPQNSVIGVDKNVIVTSFRTGKKQAHIIPETGVMVINTVLVEIDPKTKRATNIQRIDRIVDIA